MRAPAIGILSAVLTALVLSPATAEPPRRSPRASLVQVLQGGRQALILDRTTSEYQVVKLGDQIQGYRVTEIEDDQLVLASPSAPERSFVLPLVGLPVAPPSVVAPDAARAPDAAAATPAPKAAPPDAAAVTPAPKAAPSDAAPSTGKARKSGRARGPRQGRVPEARSVPADGAGADDLGPLGAHTDDLGPVTDDADVLGPIELDGDASGPADSAVDGTAPMSAPAESGPVPPAGAGDSSAGGGVGGDVIDPYAAPGPGSIPSVIAPPASRAPDAPPPGRPGDPLARGLDGPSAPDPAQRDGDLVAPNADGPGSAPAERGDDLGPLGGEAPDDLGPSSGVDDLGPSSGVDDLGPLGGPDDLGPSSGADDLDRSSGTDVLDRSSGTDVLDRSSGTGAPSNGADDRGRSGADSISGADRAAEPGASAPLPPVGAAAPRGSRPPRAAVPDADLRVVSRRELDDAMSDFSALTRQIQIEPADGGGVRVLAIAGRSFFARLGIQAGDVIHRVAGHAIDTVDGAAAAYGVLASSRSVTVEIERRGAPVRLRYRFTR